MLPLQATFAIALVLAGCSGVSTRPCPGPRVGQLVCDGSQCFVSYEGEVFERMSARPEEADELLSLVGVSRLASQGWYMSNIGKYRLYVGAESIGESYEFAPTAAGWSVKHEERGYMCLE